MDSSALIGSLRMVTNLAPGTARATSARSQRQWKANTSKPPRDAQGALATPGGGGSGGRRFRGGEKHNKVLQEEEEEEVEKEEGEEDEKEEEEKD